MGNRQEPQLTFFFYISLSSNPTPPITSTSGPSHPYFIFPSLYTSVLCSRNARAVSAQSPGLGVSEAEVELDTKESQDVLASFLPQPLALPFHITWEEFYINIFQLLVTSHVHRNKWKSTCSQGPTHPPSAKMQYFNLNIFLEKKKDCINNTGLKCLSFMWPTPLTPPASHGSAWEQSPAKIKGSKE